MRAIVAHDAGGAEVLSSWVRAHPGPSCFVLEGPARRVFERKLGVLPLVTLEDALSASGELYCGTSWQSDLEYAAIDRARSLGCRSFAFLDHWVNYQERFVRAGRVCLPDEIWVGDAEAERLALAAFPSTIVRHEPNRYFEDIRLEFLEISKARTRSEVGRESVILYVAEPIREHGLVHFGNERHFGYTEEEALRYFLSNVATVAPVVTRIVIRPHPAEPDDKYDWVQAEFGLPIVRGGVRTLVEEVADADVVVGCESMALVIALLGGTRVVSCIPPGGNACALPHRGIEHLQALRASGLATAPLKGY